jgi:hypothetical protein
MNAQNNPRNPMRKALILSIPVLLAVTGACKSSSDTAKSPANGSSGASASSVSGTPGVGVTDSSIKLGIVYPDLKAIQGLNIDHGDYQAAYTAIIDDLNNSGGINGRKIEPVFAAVNPVGTDPATAACTKLTEDDQVFAVVGSFPTEGPGCYVSTHNTAVVGGTQTNATLSAAKAPWFSYVANSDRLVTSQIEAFAKDGVFNGKKVGVVALAADQSQMNDIAVPALQHNNAAPVDTAVIDVTNNDQTAALAQVGTIAERFSSESIDVVVVVGTGALTFAQGIENTSFRPRLVATNSDSINGYVSSNTGPNPDVIKDAITTGSPLGATWDKPDLQHCVDLVQNKTGTTVQDPRTDTTATPDTFVSVTAACQNVTLFADIAKKAGQVLNNDTFKQAGDNLGTVDIPGAGTLHYSADRPDGDPPLFLSRYDSSQKKFVTDTNPTT